MILHNLTNFGFPCTACSRDLHRPLFGDPWGMSKYTSVQRNNVGKRNEETVRKWPNTCCLFLTFPPLSIVKLMRWIQDSDLPAMSIEANTYFQRKDPKRLHSLASFQMHFYCFLISPSMHRTPLQPIGHKAIAKIFSSRPARNG